MWRRESDVAHEQLARPLVKEVAVDPDKYGIVTSDDDAPELPSDDAMMAPAPGIPGDGALVISALMVPGA